MSIYLFLRESDIESGNERLGKPEREHELWPGHEELRYQALEERRNTLVLHHAADDLESALWVLEVPVLDAGLDDVEGCGHEEGGRCTSNRGNEVLEPGSLIVVAQAEEISLGES